MQRDVGAFVFLLLWLLVILCVEFRPAHTKDLCKCGVACDCAEGSNAFKPTDR